LRDQLSIYHTKTALRVGNSLSANAADLAAHTAVHYAPDKRHPRNIVHAIADKETRPLRGGCRRYEPINLFGKMLAIGIEEAHPPDFWIQSATGRTRCGEPVS